MPVAKGIDYYGVLGLTKEAEINDIKEAYRRVAVQYNAQRQSDPGLTKIFSLASEAYEVLSTFKLRAIYDKYGEGGLRKGVLTAHGFHPPHTYHGDPLKTYRNFFGTRNPYAEILEGLKDKQDYVFTPDGRVPKTQQESKIKTLALTLEEVYNGALKKMKITQKLPKSAREECPKMQEVILLVEIKRGLPKGTEITFKGAAGATGPAVTPGNLTYVTEDKPHSQYERLGVNLKMVKEVSLVDALSGMILVVNTLDGRIIKSRMTDVIRPGYVKILYGEGMPVVTDPDTFGDLHIIFKVEFPMFIPDVCKSLIGKCLKEAEEASPTKDQQETAGAREKSKTCLVSTELPKLH